MEKETFTAVCNQTVYGYKGSTRLEEPSFIKDKLYTFTTKSFTILYHGLGSYSTINERGVESIMNEKHFDERFTRITL